MINHVMVAHFDSDSWARTTMPRGVGLPASPADPPKYFGYFFSPAPLVNNRGCRQLGPMGKFSPARARLSLVQSIRRSPARRIAGG